MIDALFAAPIAAGKATESTVILARVTGGSEPSRSARPARAGERCPIHLIQRTPGLCRPVTVWPMNRNWKAYDGSDISPLFSSLRSSRMA